MYDDKRFALRPMEEIREDFRLARQVYRRVEGVSGRRRALMRKTDELLEILAMVYSLFPECQRVTCYASPRSLQVKTEEELRRLREGGLKMVYMGLESGCDAVLERMRKGPHRRGHCGGGAEGPAGGPGPVGDGHFRAWQPGAAAGPRRGHRPALSAMKPEYIGLLTLMVEPGTPLEQWVREGSFQVLGPAEILQETAPAAGPHRQRGQRIPDEPRLQLPDPEGDPEPGPARPAAAGAGGPHGSRPAAGELAPCKEQQTPLYPAGYRGRGQLVKKDKDLF